MLPLEIRSRIRISSNGCWEWTGSNNGGRYRYGVIFIDGRKLRAHRVIYELLFGPIPEGHEIDHLCRNPPCVNPKHLEAVTHAENIRRGDCPNRDKTHCPRGHAYSTENTTFCRDGSRRCRTCRREGMRKYSKAVA